MHAGPASRTLDADSRLTLQTQTPDREIAVPTLPIPIHLASWVAENRDVLKPPVGNKMIWNDGEFKVMVVGGPNIRKDFHVNLGEEFFLQIHGDITLRIIEDGQPKDVPIKEGEIFLLPGGVPHSPQRPEGTVGMVIERDRKPEELDALRWYCDACGAKVYEETFHCVDLGKQLKPVIERYMGDESLRTCGACGHVNAV
jgi:3-hydroxyanthranilate 3,4-dioxygenase